MMRIGLWGVVAAIMTIPLPEAAHSINPDPLTIPFGPSATIDGTVAPGEWASANLVTFSFVDVGGESVTANV